jgi:hypothetical protein
MKGMLKPCATSSPSKQPSGQLARRSRARRRVGLPKFRTRDMPYKMASDALESSLGYGLFVPDVEAT